MEKFIDKLKGQTKTRDLREQSLSKDREKKEAKNPCVVCSITMGKEPHAGHLFLLTMGEQIKSGLGCNLPLVLINNNTGPRSAGAVVNIAREFGLGLSDTLALMDSGVLDVSTIESAYRSRSENESSLNEAMDILALGDYDIFSTISEATGKLLKESGFNIQIASEAGILKTAREKTRSLSPKWSGTGFTPFSDSKRIVILEKSGGLTATGTLLTSILGLAETFQSDMIVTVDSMPDSMDAAFVYTSTSDTGLSIQIPGAGVGFDGEIASGTKGEALSIKEITEKFYSARPNGNLRLASTFLTLTKPLSLPLNSSNIAESFYDFKDNESLVSLLIRCYDESVSFKQDLLFQMESLASKTSSASSASDPISRKLLEFLDQKSQALLQIEKTKILSASRKVEAISSQEEISQFIKDLGYGQDRANPYISKRRTLGIRKNYYFSYLTSLVETVKKIKSLKESELVKIYQMVQFCLERTGL